MVVCLRVLPATIPPSSGMLLSSRRCTCCSKTRRCTVPSFGRQPTARHRLARWPRTTWDCSTGQMVRQVRRHADAVYSLAMTCDGQRIASVGGNGDGGDTVCRLWNAETLEVTAEWQGHAMPVYGVAFSPDGSTLATTSRDKTVRLWNVASGRHRVMQGHTSDVYRCGFSPDGRWLATASQDATVRIWDVNEARFGGMLPGRKDPLYAAVYSPTAAGWRRWATIVDCACGAPQTMNLCEKTACRPMCSTPSPLPPISGG